MKSIFFRNFVATATMVSLCFLIIMLMFIGVGQSFVSEEYEEDMKKCANEVARTAAVLADSDSLSSWVLSRNLTSIGRITDDHIFVTDTDGVIMSCSDEMPMCQHIGKQVPQRVMTQIEENDGKSVIDTLEGIYTTERIIVSAKIISGRDSSVILGYVFVTNAAKNMMHAWNTFQNAAGVAALMVFCGILFAAWLYSKRMARPLDEMAAASRKFARGDFSTRIPQTEAPSYEMGALVESFNKMADSLEKAEGRRSEFIANISHELRTPMTTISGFADGILDGTIPQEDSEKYLRSISDETKRLSRLVREMLDASQMNARAADETRRTVFDISELVLQTMLSFEQRATQKGLDVDPQIPDAHLMVKADKDAITRVIYNLIDNAVKFAASESCITVRLYKDNGKVYVSIKNIGETIPPEDLPLIFDRFHKSDKSRGMDKTGVGLGLYLVKTILNSHDEDIAVKSENGVTEFVFTLPLA